MIFAAHSPLLASANNKHDETLYITLPITEFKLILNIV